MGGVGIQKTTDTTDLGPTTTVCVLGFVAEGLGPVSSAVTAPNLLGIRIKPYNSIQLLAAVRRRTLIWQTEACGYDGILGFKAAGLLGIEPSNGIPSWSTFPSKLVVLLVCRPNVRTDFTAYTL